MYKTEVTYRLTERIEAVAFVCLAKFPSKISELKFPMRRNFYIFSCRFDVL